MMLRAASLPSHERVPQLRVAHRESVRDLRAFPDGFFGAIRRFLPTVRVGAEDAFTRNIGGDRFSKQMSLHRQTGSNEPSLAFAPHIR